MKKAVFGCYHLFAPVSNFSLADDVPLKIVALNSAANVTPVDRAVPSNVGHCKVLVKFHWIQFEPLDRRLELASAFYLFIYFYGRGLESGCSFYARMTKLPGHKRFISQRLACDPFAYLRGIALFPMCKDRESLLCHFVLMCSVVTCEVAA